MTSDLLIGLSIFRNTMRWKHFFIKQKRNGKGEKEEHLVSTIKESLNGYTNIIVEDKTEIVKYECLKNLKPSNKNKNAPLGLNDLESFLKEVETTLTKQVGSLFKKKYKQGESIQVMTKYSEIANLLYALNYL